MFMEQLRLVSAVVALSLIRMTYKPLDRVRLTHTHTHTHKHTHINIHVERISYKSEGLEGCFYKPWNTKDCQQPPRSQGIAWNRFRRNQPCPHLDLKLLASKTARENTFLFF